MIWNTISMNMVFQNLKELYHLIGEHVTDSLLA